MWPEQLDPSRLHPWGHLLLVRIAIWSIEAHEVTKCKQMQTDLMPRYGSDMLNQYRDLFHSLLSSRKKSRLVNLDSLDKLIEYLITMTLKSKFVSSSIPPLNYRLSSKSEFKPQQWRQAQSMVMWPAQNTRTSKDRVDAILVLANSSTVCFLPLYWQRP